MIYGRNPLAKNNYFHGLAIGDLYDGQTFVEKNYKHYIWDENKERIKQMIGIPFKSRNPICISETRLLMNVLEIKIFGTDWKIYEQVASMNLYRNNNLNESATIDIWGGIISEDLFTDKYKDDFDCTDDILQEITI